MRKFLLFVCAIVATLAAQTAHAETQVRLLGTWPAGDAVTLYCNQNFYLHFAYTSDQPVHIWVQPYFHGKSVHAGTNTSRTYPAGSGEALGWFFLFDPGEQVDEIRVKAGDGSYNRTSVVATFPVAVTGGGELADEKAAKPDWLTTLSAADKAAQDAAYKQAMDTPPALATTSLFTVSCWLFWARYCWGLSCPSGACGAGATPGASQQRCR